MSSSIPVSSLHHCISSCSIVRVKRTKRNRSGIRRTTRSERAASAVNERGASSLGRLTIEESRPATTQARSRSCNPVRSLFAPLIHRCRCCSCSGVAARRRFTSVCSVLRAFLSVKPHPSLSRLRSIRVCTVLRPSHRVASIQRAKQSSRV